MQRLVVFYHGLTIQIVTIFNAFLLYIENSIVFAFKIRGLIHATNMEVDKIRDFILA